MGTIASQINSLTIVYSTVYSGADQSKHQSSASLAFVWGIHRGPVNSPHKWPVTRKMFPFDDVIMSNTNTVKINTLSCLAFVKLIISLKSNIYMATHTQLFRTFCTFHIWIFLTLSFPGKNQRNGWCFTLPGVTFYAGHCCHLFMFYVCFEFATGPHIKQPVADDLSSGIHMHVEMPLIFQ